MLPLSLSILNTTAPPSNLTSLFFDSSILSSLMELLPSWSLMELLFLLEDPLPMLLDGESLPPEVTVLISSSSSMTHTSTLPHARPTSGLASLQDSKSALEEFPERAHAKETVVVLFSPHPTSPIQLTLNSLGL
jgi:hypothetical protein